MLCTQILINFQIIIDLYIKIKLKCIHKRRKYESYIAKRDEAHLAQNKECYDRARAVCKWASTCGATIKAQRVEQGKLHSPYKDRFVLIGRKIIYWYSRFRLY